MSNSDFMSKQEQDTMRRLAEARRGSLTLAEHTLGDIFARRASGFSELDGLAFRRGSLDSTSAVLDAAIMDLHSRRMSMAMGIGIDPFADGYSVGLDNVVANGGLASGLSLAATNPLASITAEALSASEARSLNFKDNRKEDSTKSLHEEQQELDRRQRELEQQRLHLVAAMDERRTAMQHMQQKLGQMESSNGFSNFQSSMMPMSRNCLLGSFGGGLSGQAGNGLSSLMALPGATSHQQVAMSLNNRDDLMHDPFGMAAGRASMSRASLGLGAIGRRTSLDLLVGSLDRPDFASRFANQQTAALGRRGSLGFSFGDFVDTPGLMMQQQQGLQHTPGLMNLAQQQQSQLQQMSQYDSIVSSSASVPNSGPFETMTEPLPLAMEGDEDWLTPLHCFVRKHCVEVFTASEDDITTPSKGKRKAITIGQVGIRCPHCRDDSRSTAKARERGSVYFPTSLSSIYNATMNLLQRHFHSCTSVPPEIRRRFETLKADDARSGTSKQYWVDSARSLGLVDTENGIRYSTMSRPPLPTRNSANAKKSSIERSPTDADDSVEDAPPSFTSSSLPSGIAPHEGPIGEDGPLVRPEDAVYATEFSFHLLCQMLPCVFTEADRLGKRKGLPPGFPGLACRHCFGGFGSGRFFPSSIKTLSDTSKTLNVLHNHMIRCRKCPPEIREILAATRKTHDDQRAKMKFGSQKAFFARIWDRLHYKDPNVTSKRKFKRAESNEPPPKQPRLGMLSDDENAAAVVMAQIDSLGGMQQRAGAVITQPNVELTSPRVPPNPISYYLS